MLWLHSGLTLLYRDGGGLRSCWHRDLGVGGGHYQGPLPTGSRRESRISVTKGNPLLVCRG